uniref:Uncharacterized protein n=1 Tax=Chromera velia CCMP2878 TaxID=1169474 RepID=A0A0G4I0Z1_9ALVE|eukprot:Cvel_10075.t1-p1 / transcript=Cvel_10075.t1 / gene=Cvel_10075 / organism=Chromera_velia_CCMP2878 / gene_product=hypothetical protein / transcript_product=hypothetical protein / location=Cvel_scaffold599:71603-77025(+) / protein_length=175 / sequence_SO=supercontig / SO=protein_coding / is_pseudo=false
MLSNSTWWMRNTCPFGGVVLVIRCRLNLWMTVGILPLPGTFVDCLWRPTGTFLDKRGGSETLETLIAPREVDRDASPSADPWERPQETFALQNMRPKDDVCPYLFSTPRQEPLAIAGAPLDGHASPAGPCGRLERSSKCSKVTESSLGPEGAAWELLQAVSRACLPWRSQDLLTA